MKELQKQEKAFRQWTYVRKYRIPLFVLLVALLYAFSNAPYMNLFLNAYFIILICVILSPFILKIDARFFILAAISLFLYAFIIWFTDQDRAEMIGNYIFILLLTGVMKTYFSD